MATLKDYILDEGIKGKKFVDPEEGIYKVDDIEILGKGSPTSFLMIEGKKENAIYNDYLKKLTFCLNHEEFLD